MNWIYNNTPLLSIPNGFKGFIYIIHNTTNNKLYIGKKSFFFKKNKKTVESDWKSYTGSNKSLNQDILSNHSYQKYIIHLTKSKAENSYLELLYQIHLNSLTSPIFYNEWIKVTISKKHISSIHNSNFNPLNTIHNINPIISSLILNNTTNPYENRSHSTIISSP